MFLGVVRTALKSTFQRGARHLKLFHLACKYPWLHELFFDMTYKTHRVVLELFWRNFGCALLFFENKELSINMSDKVRSAQGYASIRLCGSDTEDCSLHYSIFIPPSFFIKDPWDLYRHIQDCKILRISAWIQRSKLSQPGTFEAARIKVMLWSKLFLVSKAHNFLGLLLSIINTADLQVAFLKF